jgi:hypothetical protein
MRTTSFAFALFSLVAAGCGSSTDDTAIQCDPPCPKGLTCTVNGCVAPDGSAGVVDFAGGGDFTVANCSPPCAAPTPWCNGNKVCVPCLDDSHCPAKSVCRVVGGTSACVPGCNDDARCNAGGADGGSGPLKCCAGQCLDTSRDPQNCGACGSACGVQHSSASCQAGVCMPGMCSAGWADCNNDPKDGCEAKLDYDADNCGACGMKCAIPNAIQGCGPVPMGAKSGCYIKACTFGWDDCNGNADDGCETSVLSDAKNCGGCGMPCAKVAHATVSCVNAACALTQCDVGFLDCDGNAKNGCETVASNDVNNCGKCGAACGQGQVCINGGCTCANCNIANAATKCVNNACVFDHCVQGFADCDNNLNNGCETNLNTDNNNCSACGMACPQMQTCQGGACMKCGNDCWGPTGCLTAQGRCIMFTCRAGNAGQNMCNGCNGWKDVTYDQWMNQGYCADVIATYRISDGTATHCGNAPSCCKGKNACGGGDNAWHFFDTNSGNNYFTGPCLGCGGDTNCKFWNNVDNSGYTRITICAQ